jgi:ribosomal protein S18 acetylase RimI-like enzyme
MSGLFSISKLHINTAAKVCARAFMDDPQIKYFFPESSEREKKLYLFYAFLIRYGLCYGTVYAPSKNIEGVMIWLPSEKSHMTIWRLLRCGVSRLLRPAGIKRIWLLQKFAEPVFQLHKRCAPFPHGYLFLLAVAPEFQGQGFASKLLNPLLARYDTWQLPTFLETHTKTNVAIYEKFGYQVIEKIALPKTKLNFWGMVRRPG